MKCLWLLVAILAAFAAGEDFLFKMPEVDPTYGDAEYLKREKDILLVLKYIHQPYWNADLHAFADSYSISDDYENYNNVN